MTSMGHGHRFTARQAQAGTLMFAAGLIVLGLSAWDNSSGLPFAMPAFWDNQRTICLLVAMGVSAFGWFVMTNRPTALEDRHPRTSWKPTRAGLRFRSLKVYSRSGCHLCDEAMELLQRYSAYLPPILEVDIDADPALKVRFDIDVPVVEIDGRIRFKARVSELLLRRLIEGTPPNGSDSA